MSRSNPQSRASHRRDLEPQERPQRTKTSNPLHRSDGSLNQSLSSLATGLVSYCLSQGISIEEVTEKTGIEKRALLDPECRIEDVALSRLWLLLSDKLGDEPTPIHVAQATSFGFFGPWFYPSRFAPTLGDAIDTMVRYSAVLGDRLRVHSEERDGLCHVWANHPNDQLDGGRMSELGFAMTHRLLTEVIGAGDAISQIHIQMSQECYLDVYESFFGRPVVMGQPENTFVIPLGEMTRPTRDAEPALYQYAVEHLNFLGERWRLPAVRDPLDPVRLAVARVAKRGRYDVDAIAAELHMSVRSLQRFCRLHGETVRNLIECVRAEDAIDMVRRGGVDFAELARRLGYADDRSFRRAFRRWTGKSPKEYQSSHREEEESSGTISG